MFLFVQMAQSTSSSGVCFDFGLLIATVDGGGGGHCRRLRCRCRRRCRRHRRRRCCPRARARASRRVFCTSDRLDGDNLRCGSAFRLDPPAAHIARAKSGSGGGSGVALISGRADYGEPR